VALRVGILTFHWTYHIGALLQTFALYNTLRFYFNSVVINFLPRLAVQVMPTINVLKAVKKYRGNGVGSTLKGFLGEAGNYMLWFTTERRRELYHRQFLKMLNLTSEISTLRELHENLRYFDVVVVGSDQVWRPDFLPYADYAYLLPFKLEKTKKVAYAASFGVDNLNAIPGKLLTIYSRSLRDFGRISIREQSHISWVSKLVGIKVEHALDPTFLMDASFWKSLALRPDLDRLKDSDFIFIYNLGFEMIKSMEPLLTSLSRRGFQLVAYRTPHLFPLTLGVSDIRYYAKLKRKTGIVFLGFIDPFEFLYLIAESKYVITDSYHGTIFSILFEKNFISISPRKTSIRILDLLGLMGLEERVAHRINEVWKKLDEEIEYRNVRRRIEFHRRRSYDFLISAVKDYGRL